MTDAELRRVAEAVAERLDRALDDRVNVAVRVLPGSVAPGRLAVRAEQAAEMLGVSRDFFDSYIAPEVRCVTRGRLRLFPVRELEAWLEQNSAIPLHGGRR